MKRPYLLLPIALVAGCAAPDPTERAPAAPPAAGACAERGSAIALLAQRYGETLRGGGLTAGTILVERYATESGDTWTITGTSPDGTMCLLGAGENWRVVRPPPDPGA